MPVGYLAYTSSALKLLKRRRPWHREQCNLHVASGVTQAAVRTHLSNIFVKSIQAYVWYLAFFL